MPFSTKAVLEDENVDIGVGITCSANFFDYRYFHLILNDQGISHPSLFLSTN
jgi:hypothetical protein